MIDSGNLSLKKEIAYDILINENSVLNEIMNDVLNNHPYTISPPSKEGGRWQTSYKGSDGKRKNIKASSKEALIRKLIKLYSAEADFDKRTFKDLYDEWIVYKETITNSLNTIKRHNQHYKKYLETSKLHSMKLNRIDDM